MGLLAPNPGGWVDSRIDGRAREIDQLLREGFPPAGLPGDPALELHFRPMEGGGGPEGRWEVWRHCEDGVCRPLAWWGADELELILPGLGDMRLDSPAHVDVGQRIDAANADTEERAFRDWRDSYGEMSEHFHRLLHDTTEPRTRFRGMPGRRRD